jgi:hypothetical protein
MSTAVQRSPNKLWRSPYLTYGFESAKIVGIQPNTQIYLHIIHIYYYTPLAPTFSFVWISPTDSSVGFLREVFVFVRVSFIYLETDTVTKECTQCTNPWMF